MTDEAKKKSGPKPPLFIFYEKEGNAFQIVNVLGKQKAMDYMLEHPELGVYKYIPPQGD